VESLLVDASLLVRVAKRFRNEMESHFKGTGLNSCQFWVLHRLDQHGGMTQGALSALAGVDRTALVSLLDELEEKNCVTRNAIPDDRRANLIELTSKGREVLDESRRVYGTFQRSFFSGLTDQEKQNLNAHLEKLA